LLKARSVTESWSRSKSTRTGRGVTGKKVPHNCLHLISFTTDLISRGCVTPSVIHNWWEEAEHDLDRIDGLDEVPEEVQETVKRALQQGHVDDEDWAGV
jgi:hypothetical protein